MGPFFKSVAIFAMLGLAVAAPLSQSVANSGVNLEAAADNTVGEYNGAVASEPLPAALKNAEAALEQANAAVEQAAAALDTSSNAAATATTETEAKVDDAAPAAADDAAPAAADDAAPAAADETAPAAADDAAPAAADETAPAAADDAAPAAADEAASAADPCNSACTPKIDVKASVVESYKRHRAQAALIGDYGSCGVGGAGEYIWTVDWGDDESYAHKRDTIGPYQAEHVYSKKGKYTVEATFCHKLDGCDSGCTSMSKKLHVKP